MSFFDFTGLFVDFFEPDEHITWEYDDQPTVNVNIVSDKKPLDLDNISIRFNLATQKITNISYYSMQNVFEDTGGFVGALLPIIMLFLGILSTT